MIQAAKNNSTQHTTDFINKGKLSSNQNIITEEFEKFILY